MLLMWVLGPRLRALEFTVNVMVFAVVVTVPDVDDAVSQLGVVTEYFTRVWRACSKKGLRAGARPPRVPALDVRRRGRASSQLVRHPRPVARHESEAVEGRCLRRVNLSYLSRSTSCLYLNNGESK
jgi:hypothetical protein